MVQVGQHPAVYNNSNNPYNHTAIVLRPNNPSDFANHPLFASTNGASATLGAHGELGWNWTGNLLILTSAPNYSGDDPCNLNDLTTVGTPKGMSDTNFINALIKASQSYNNDSQYNLYPIQGGVGYNSNSYVSGVVIKAGGQPPQLAGVQPGYNVPLPLP